MARVLSDMLPVSQRIHEHTCPDGFERAVKGRQFVAFILTLDRSLEPT
jgi:hypothetical protein